MTSAVHPPQAAATRDGRAHRASVREIREATWRALYASGASAGEATVAAAAVAFTEVLTGRGLEALVAELPTVPTGRTPVALRSSDDVHILDDPAHRGLLLLAPLAIGLAVTRLLSPPVLLPGVLWHPVLAGLLVRHCRPAEPALVALELDDDGQLGQGLRVWPDRSVEVFTADDKALLQQLDVRSGQAKGSTGRGVLLMTTTGRPAPGLTVTFPAETVVARQQTAFTDGVLVEADLWSAVDVAAARYFVAER